MAVTISRLQSGGSTAKLAHVTIEGFGAAEAVGQRHQYLAIWASL